MRMVHRHVDVAARTIRYFAKCLTILIERGAANPS